MPVHIYYLARCLQKTTSKAGVHHYMGTASHYALKSQFNALLEILLWFKDLMQKQKIK
ncbi:hypothetical protein Q0590_29010 [Rhodocytophaga aerolata]|uniref:Uncharacterized protein n=1 Tax=Rhodocytophaga aerolata TaxID=455078 RepID=A0ABT8RE15_9BACT|nr:hypothetical protein [Rhodocytophaga aerolata]MDO1450351.1 hypothetical protein [Rhodocytophaga aerolata]